jgi:DNA-binding response OmpR family regulator
VGTKHRDGKQLHESLRRRTDVLSRLAPREEAGFASVLKYKPDILVLNPDAELAGMLEYYQMLKKEPATADIPLVALVDEADLGRTEIPSGIQDVFCRPLRESECAARIGLLYRKSNRLTDKNVIVQGPLEIDAMKYEVRVDGRKVDLTYTEYELLKFLATHPDNVFSRDVLLNKVWGYEYYGGARTVDVHIRRLRSKIEKKSARFIETVRNIGYKFISQEE